MSPHAEAREAACSALAGVDRALAARPAKDDLALSDATQALTTLRDLLAVEAAAGAPEGRERARLEAVNAVLGVVLGVRFPVGQPSWTDLEAARGWLAGLLDG